MTALDSARWVIFAVARKGYFFVRVDGVRVDGDPPVARFQSPEREPTAFSFNACGCVAAPGYRVEAEEFRH